MEAQASASSPRKYTTSRQGQTDCTDQYPRGELPPSYEETTLRQNVYLSAHSEQFQPRYTSNVSAPPPQAAHRFPLEGDIPDSAFGFAAPCNPDIYKEKNENIAATRVLVVQPTVRPLIVSPPPDWLGCAIFVTLCCCCPLGLCAIIQASKARGAFAGGDVNKGRSLAESAKKFVIASLVVGIIIGIVTGVLRFKYSR